MPFPLVPAVIALATAATPESTALVSLVAAERGFSRMSVEQGMRAAFLEHLADDGIVFQPLPVNGKSVWGPRPPSPATLIWEPAFAEVSAAGDLGYTTGPWEYRPPADANRPTLHGHFHSVWRRQGNGPWKVAVDIGGAHEEMDPGVGSGAFEAGPAHVASSRGDRRRAAGREIMAAEKRFSNDAERRGFGTAFETVAARDVRLGREGKLPALGIEAARSALLGDGRARWTLAGSGAARSGDLGFAFGVRERLRASATADTSAFLDV